MKVDHKMSSSYNHQLKQQTRFIGLTLDERGKLERAEFAENFLANSPAFVLLGTTCLFSSLNLLLAKLRTEFETSEKLIITGINGRQ